MTHIHQENQVQSYNFSILERMLQMPKDKQSTTMS